MAFLKPMPQNGGQVPRSIKQNYTQQPAQTTPHTLFMMGSELACGVWVPHPQDAVGAGCRAEEKQQPSALQIRDMKNPVQEDWVFNSDVTQLLIDVLTVSKRRRLDRLSTPLQWGQLSWLQSTNVNRTVPIRPDGLRCGINPQITLNQVENGDSSVWSATWTMPFVLPNATGRRAELAHERQHAVISLHLRNMDREPKKVRFLGPVSNFDSQPLQTHLTNCDTNLTHSSSNAANRF